MEKSFLKLMANCIPVKGASRGIIYDIQRSSFDLIPNSMCDFIKDSDRKKIVDIKAEYAEADQDTITEYIDFLLNNEYAFLTDNPEYFPDLDLSWRYPGEISNAIIDWHESSSHDYLKIFSELSSLGCSALQLRFFDPILREKLGECLDALGNLGFSSCELVLAYDEAYTTKESLPDLADDYPIITLLYIHSSPIEESYFSEKYETLQFNFSRKCVTDEKHCGFVNTSRFSVNMSSFTEALSYNTCLNKKISVDKHGHIKNCPACAESFGHHKEVSLNEALMMQDFKKFWSMNKDQVNVCQVCEFRYMCTDCRVFTQENSPTGKPSKCKYDPYSMSWSDDTDNRQE